MVGLKLRPVCLFGTMLGLACAPAPAGEDSGAGSESGGSEEDDGNEDEEGSSGSDSSGGDEDNDSTSTSTSGGTTSGGGTSTSTSSTTSGGTGDTTGTTGDTTGTTTGTTGDTSTGTTMDTTTSGGEETGPAIDFATQIQPIFDANCAVAGCHVAGHPTMLNLSAGASYASIVGVASPTGTPYIDPGAVEGSWLHSKITGQQGANGNQMPPPPRQMLGAEDIQLIADWIMSGAPE